MTWQPSADINTLKLRAQFLADIRQFFNELDVLEVETPILSRHTITDLHLDPFATQFDFDASGEVVPLYLQTSPEFHMKRLLAAGSGPIFQITKSFRNETRGRQHNPEFTMLEWYRPGFNDRQLMAEVDGLVQRLLNTPKALSKSYQAVFIEYLGFDPLTTSLAELKQQVVKYSEDDWLQQEDNSDHLLQWLFSVVIEPKLGDTEDVPCFIYDFPASQAALAKINQNDPRVAHRFELYFRGVELANGYFELQNADEQRARFAADNEQRKAANKPCYPVDKYLISALEHGLPSCAGVALGVDRLFMLKTRLNDIANAVSFGIDKA